MADIALVLMAMPGRAVAFGLVPAGPTGLAAVPVFGVHLLVVELLLGLLSSRPRVPSLVTLAGLAFGTDSVLNPVPPPGPT